MGANFKVLKIDELTRMSDERGVEHYYRHTIKTKGGVVLTADISQEDFTAEKAAPILDRKAVEADKILKL